MRAAQLEFGSRGYSGTRIADIAKAAGITQSGIYQYFASKQELYQAAYGGAQAEVLTEVSASIAACDTFSERIRTIFAACARIYAERPPLIPFLATLPMELRRHPDLVPMLQARSIEFTTALQGMFADARAAGEVRPDVGDAELTTTLMGAILGVGLTGFGFAMDRIDGPFASLTAAFEGHLFSALHPDAAT